MANYIHSLQDQVAATEAHDAALNTGIEELIVYLSSAKFRCGDELDGYVHVTDVIARLRMAQHSATVAEVTAAPLAARALKIAA